MKIKILFHIFHSFQSIQFYFTYFANLKWMEKTLKSSPVLVPLTPSCFHLEMSFAFENLHKTFDYLKWFQFFHIFHRFRTKLRLLHPFPDLCCARTIHTSSSSFFSQKFALASSLSFCFRVLATSPPQQKDKSCPHLWQRESKCQPAVWRSWWCQPTRSC